MLRSLSFQFILDFLNLLKLILQKFCNDWELNPLMNLMSFFSKALASRSAQQSSHDYIIQSSTLENSLSYLFTPFIHAVLNRDTVYIAPRQNIVEQVYAHYFRLDALELEKPAIHY